MTNVIDLTLNELANKIKSKEILDNLDICFTVLRSIAM